TLEVGNEPIEATGRTIDRRHPGASGDELCGLTSRCGAKIDDLMPAKATKQARRQCGGRVLNPPGALGIPRQGDGRATGCPAQRPGRQQYSLELVAPGLGIVAQG